MYPRFNLSGEQADILWDNMMQAPTGMWMMHACTGMCIMNAYTGMWMHACTDMCKYNCITHACVCRYAVLYASVKPQHGKTWYSHFNVNEEFLHWKEQLRLSDDCKHTCIVHMANQHGPQMCMGCTTYTIGTVTVDLVEGCISQDRCGFCNTVQGVWDMTSSRRTSQCMQQLWLFYMHDAI